MAHEPGHVESPAPPGNESADGNATGTGGGGFWDDLMDSFQGGFEQVEFALLLIAFILVAFVAGKLLRLGFLRLRRQQPTSGALFLARLMHIGLVAAAVIFGLHEIYGVDPFRSLAAVGVLSLVLGFGLQNTVANLAAGVSLTVDKPFDVGDRVKVGETWGDVTSIGMRSTTILTVRGEHVTIPNSFLDTQEVWNYTHGPYRKIRLDIPIGITYSSSIPLAEHLALQVARGTKGILAYPEPAVRFMGFGSDSVSFELRTWIDHAEDRAAIRDKLIRGVKEAFDKEHVHFPFPQRTVSYLKELKPAAETPDFLSEIHQSKPVVLACFTHMPPPSIPERVVEFVERLDARLIALHIRPPQEALNSFVAQEAVNGFLQRAHQRKVPVQGRMEVGDVAPTIQRVARQVDARLVVLGRTPRHRLGMAWHRKDFTSIGRASPAPVIVLDVEHDLDSHVIERWKKRLAPPEEEEPEEEPTPPPGPEPEGDPPS